MDHLRLTNDIDLSGEGGLIWTKCRTASQYHRLVDTARGVNRDLITNGTLVSRTKIVLILKVYQHLIVMDIILDLMAL